MTPVTGQRLQGKVAVVTGGASGIGAATVERFRAEGAHAYAADLTVQDGPDTLALDVTDEASVERAFDRVIDEHGRLDICVANAGISPTFTHVTELDADVWRKVLDVNLTGSFLTLRAAARRMLAAGNGGRLLATSSVGGLRGGPGGSAYASTKFALRGLTQSMALELAPAITVNLVAPGDTDTALHARVRDLLAAGGDESADEILAAMEQAVPAGRLAQPEEIAAAYAYLASDEAAYVTGTVLVVDGGSLLQRRPRR